MSSDKVDKKLPKKISKVIKSEKVEKISYPVSDDIFDELETKVEQFNDTSNISEKMVLHNELKETILQLEQEIDNMVEIVDKLETDVIDNPSDTDITDDVISIEKMVDGMKEEEIMQTKLAHLKKIINKIQGCKSRYGSSNLHISKCS